MKKYISSIDSNRFGFLVAKVNEFDQPPEKTIEELRKLDVKLVMSRVSFDDVELVNSLERAGFLFKDLKITYRHELNEKQVVEESFDDIILRNADINDVDELVAIGTESFNGYGHYAMDSNLEPNKCLQIYEDWISRCVVDDSVADKVIVAQIDNEVAGFLSLKTHFKPYHYGEALIGAVASRFRRRNIFKAILSESLTWGNETKQSWQVHSTLVNNYPINKVYASHQGFYIFESFITFHCWL